LTELTGVGAELKQAREERGLSIEDVAQQLKFAPRQIESLEAERFERLPGPTIARGMVRNYARLLKLEAEPILERLAPRVASAIESSDLAVGFKPSVPFSDSGRRSTLIYAGFSVGVLALVGAVGYEWHQERAVPEFVAPAQPQRPPSVPAQSAAVTPAPMLIQERPAAPIVEKTEPKSEVENPRLEAEKPKAEAEKPKAEAEKPKAEAEKPKAEAEESKPVPPGLQRLVLRCEQEAWIEVRDSAGRLLVSSLNPAGCERVVHGRPPFELVIGNASHVTLTRNGRQVDLKPYIKVEVARFTLK
jgi:cytoskeleton protein RodZ